MANDNGEKSARIYLTKLGAAERMLNAAIRMLLDEEDELAVHVVAASAYRTLRDLKAKRGSSDTIEPFRRGIFYIARDLASGKASEILAELKASTEIVQLVEHVADEIRAGRYANYLDIPMKLSTSEAKFWADYNKPFNFLKHAEKDHAEAIDIESVDNNELFSRLVPIFIEITNRLTPEIEAYWILTYCHDKDGIAWQPELGELFSSLEIAERKAKLLCWLGRYKELRFEEKKHYVSLVSLVNGYYVQTGELCP